MLILVGKILHKPTSFRMAHHLLSGLVLSSSIEYGTKIYKIRKQFFSHKATVSQPIKFSNLPHILGNLQNNKYTRKLDFMPKNGKDVRIVEYVRENIRINDFCNGQRFHHN